MNNVSPIITIIIVLLISAVIFAMIRSFWLWYFQIEERTKLLREQNEVLKAIFQQLGGSIEDSDSRKKSE